MVPCLSLHKDRIEEQNPLMHVLAQIPHHRLCRIRAGEAGRRMTGTDSMKPRGQIPRCIEEKEEGKNSKTISSSVSIQHNSATGRRPDDGLGGGCQSGDPYFRSHLPAYTAFMGIKGSGDRGQKDGRPHGEHFSRGHAKVLSTRTTRPGGKVRRLRT